MNKEKFQKVLNGVCSDILLNKTSLSEPVTNATPGTSTKPQGEEYVYVPPALIAEMLYILDRYWGMIPQERLDDVRSIFSRRHSLLDKHQKVFHQAFVTIEEAIERLSKTRIV